MSHFHAHLDLSTWKISMLQLDDWTVKRSKERRRAKNAAVQLLFVFHGTNLHKIGRPTHKVVIEISSFSWLLTIRNWNSPFFACAMNMSVLPATAQFWTSEGVAVPFVSPFCGCYIYFGLPWNTSFKRDPNGMNNDLIRIKQALDPNTNTPI